MQLLTLNIKEHKIPLIYEYSDNTQLVNIKFIFQNSGKIANHIAGVSNLLAGILNEGSKNFTSLEFFSNLEQRAIELEANSHEECFTLEIFCLKEYFKYALSLLISILNEPKFTQETLKLVKQKILGLIQANKSDLDYQAKLLLNSIIYKNSAFEYPAYGDENSLNNITLEDIEQFFKNHLTYENLFITLGGNINIKELDLSSLKLSNDKSKNFSCIRLDSSCTLKEVKMPSEQAYIYFAAPFDIDITNRYKAKIASFILGSSGFGSRLMEEIRVKKGLAYSAYAYNIFSRFQTGIFGYLQTKNKNKDDSIALVKAIFKKFISDGVSKDELKSAKKFLIGSEVLNKETLFKRLNIAESDYYISSNIDEFDRILTQIHSLSLDDLNEFIKTHTEIYNLSFAVIYG